MVHRGIGSLEQIRVERIAKELFILDLSGMSLLGLFDGVRDIKAGNTGRVVSFPPATEIRESIGLSQSQLAKLLGVSVRTLQEWEQGRRAPSGEARTLLAIASQNPQAS